MIEENTMSEIDPIAKLAMTPRSQKEAGIHYLEWKDDSIHPAALVVIFIAIFIAGITLFAVSI